MKTLIDKIIKIGGLSIADKKCEGCVFKVVHYEDEPCFSCKHGKYCGIESNFVKVENDK